MQPSSLISGHLSLCSLSESDGSRAIEKGVESTVATLDVAFIEPTEEIATASAHPSHGLGIQC